VQVQTQMHSDGPTRTWSSFFLIFKLIRYAASRSPFLLLVFHV
jgi:hypothetical protein